MQLNPEQLKAVETIDSNLAVNAGAGTGKTKVLTDRFLYILEKGDLKENKEIESIVAITFTNKATQEMIERIRDGISQNIPKGDRWRRFYRDLDRANISTIHGFCAGLLRENPIEANIDPYFEVLDDVLSCQLLNESIQKVLGNWLDDKKDTLPMMKLLNKNKIEDLKGDIYSLYNEIRTIGVSFEEVKEETLTYISSLEFKEEYIQEIIGLIEYIMSKSRSDAKILRIRDDDLWLDFKNKDFKEDIFTYIEFIKEHLGNNKSAQEEVDRVHYLIDCLLLYKEKEYLWIYESLTDILIEIDREYRLRKAELGGLDYDDLQIKVLNLLENPEILRKYQEKYRYFMIDEFQDTNELQKKIFYKLATKEKPLDRQNLFIVGDPKQSIYGFRGADIDVFYDVMNDIQSKNQDKVITLKTNYRSLDTILDFVNAVFSPIMEDKYDELVPFKKSNNEIDIEVLEKEVIQGNADEISYYEADLIAKRIKSLVKEGRFKYKDIAILFRASTRNYIYEEALKDYNIPYFNSSSKRFFYRQEILDLLNGLKAISNPYDKIATIGFLRSPMVGLKDTSIYWTLKYLEDNIYKTILKIKDNPIFNESERVKLKEAAALLGYFYKAKSFYNLSEVVSLLVDKTYFIESSLLKAEGDQIVANIYKFIEMTNDFQAEHNKSLEDYIDYLERLKESSESEGIIQSEEDDAVKLLTIHGSKGLQFPLVIIPEMAKSHKHSSSNILYAKELGIGIKSKESEGLFQLIKKDKQESEDEELSRILYVAMTRAEEMLILGCFGKNSGFKKMIKDYLPSDKYRILSDIDMEKEAYIPVKTLGDNLTVSDVKSTSLPLLYDLGGYNSKEFISFNISQYQKFKICRRLFYLEHYWGLKLGMMQESDEIEDIDYDFDLKEETKILKGHEKGNIVHEFCHKYRDGMDVDNLLLEIVNSYGIEYNQGLEEEIRPYVDNYMKIHREDYDEIYTERPFYLAVGDKYIKGIIDRITIKEGNIEIVDFKTNRLWNKNKLIELYEPQLQLYAYAVEKILGQSVAKSKIVFLENGDVAEVDISKDKLEENFNRIRDFIDYVEQHKDLASYEPAVDCDKYCIYQAFCQPESR